jgi:transcriptional repressor NrdR
MMCPFCRHDETKVVDSRTSQSFSIRRRRECLACERRFTTYERVEESPIKVIKKDGTRVPFDRERIRSGLEKACYKRPISDARIEAIIATVEADAMQEFDREVPSRYIGERVIEALREVDQVAFVRFASVYREFKDVNDFVEELEPMLRVRPGELESRPTTRRSAERRGVELEEAREASRASLAEFKTRAAQKRKVKGNATEVDGPLVPGQSESDAGSQTDHGKGHRTPHRGIPKSERDYDGDKFHSGEW